MPFNGRALYDDRVTVGEDVSSILELFAPMETPFLNLLLPASMAARDTTHKWTQEGLAPVIMTTSTAINSATADTGATVASGAGTSVAVGMLLQIEGSDPINDEVVRVTSVVGANSILFSRNFNSTGIDSLVVGGTLRVLGMAQLEGNDHAGDVTIHRTRVENYTQIIDRPITISGTARAVSYNPDVADELDHQSAKGIREVMRDLERFMFRGTVTNSIGSDTAPRTMRGLMQAIATVNSTVATNSFTAAPIDYLSDTWQQAWNNGADDIDLLVCGDNYKKLISRANTSLYNISQSETRRQERIEEIDTDFGRVQLMLTRWLPTNWAIGLSTRRVFATPLQGRSFAVETISKTGDSDKRLVVGEYTLEHHNEQGMFQLHV